MSLPNNFAYAQLRKDFSILKVIHSAAFSMVYLARSNRDGKTYILKERKKPEMTKGGKLNDLLHEAHLLYDCGPHPNIVHCLGFFRDQERDSAVIVLEYCEGGDLDSLIKARRQESSSAYERNNQEIKGRNRKLLKEKSIWKIFYQICSGLKHLHTNGIIHRDIKPLNIFITKNYKTFKLGDLGVSRQVSPDTLMINSFCGTPLYLSPELLNIYENSSKNSNYNIINENSSPNQSYYNEKTDIWSLGVLLYELCVLYPPFNASNYTELVQKMKSMIKKSNTDGKNSILFDDEEILRTNYSKDMNKFIRWLLSIDFKKRPNITQICEYVENKLKQYEKEEDEDYNIIEFNTKKSLEIPVSIVENQPVASSNIPSSPPRPSSSNRVSSNYNSENDDDIDEDSLDEDSLDGKDNNKMLKANTNANSRAQFKPLPDLPLSPPPPTTNYKPQSPLQDFSQLRKSLPSDHNPISPPKLPQAPAVEEDLNEEFLVDLLRVHAKLRKENLKLRKLLQMREFLNPIQLDEVNQNNDGDLITNNNDQINLVLKEIKDTKNNIIILEKSLDSGKMSKKYIIKFNLPIKNEEIIHKPVEHIKQEVKKYNEDLPVYLQGPPRYNYQESKQNSDEKSRKAVHFKEDEKDHRPMSRLEKLQQLNEDATQCLLPGMRVGSDDKNKKEERRKKDNNKVNMGNILNYNLSNDQNLKHNNYFDNKSNNKANMLNNNIDNNKNEMHLAYPPSYLPSYAQAHQPPHLHQQYQQQAQPYQQQYQQPLPQHQPPPQQQPQIQLKQPLQNQAQHQSQPPLLRPSSSSNGLISDKEKYYNHGRQMSDIMLPYEQQKRPQTASKQRPQTAGTKSRYNIITGEY